ncbi:MAG: hypothetical protein HOY69_06670 [Streptomyces sp.]|nr:hypothetical protein [Streptomyces sp.]
MRRTALATAVAAMLLPLAACSSHADGGDGEVPDYVTLMRRTTHGVRWQLDAWESPQGLCLAVDGPAGPGSSGALGAAGSGACTFGPPTKDAADNSFWFAGSEPGLPDGAVTVSYGPVPPETARVQVATHLDVAAHPLPAGHHLPRADVWWAVYAPGGTTGTALPNPRPIAASGRVLPLRPY